MNLPRENSSLSAWKDKKSCVLVLLASLSLSACGGSAGGAATGSGPTSTTPTTTYTLGGSVSGLSGTGLMVQDNGSNNLSITANGPFTFESPVTSGESYDLTFFSQPSGPVQTCTATNGSGTATSNVTGIQIACVTVTFAIGGTVSGLSGTGLILQDNGGNNLPIATNGSFTFNAPLDSGANYSVSVATQPSNPAQSCGVTNGVGSAAANVASIQIACRNGTGSQWTWIGGSDVWGQAGTYGTQGVASPSNFPDPRDSASSWTDSAGTFWLFGGYYLLTISGSQRERVDMGRRGKYFRPGRRIRHSRESRSGKCSGRPFGCV